MNIQAHWTIGGDFIISDADEDAPLVEVKLHEPMRSQAIDDVDSIAKAIAAAMIQTPHPYADAEKEVR
jgi:hypothetical protein